MAELLLGRRGNSPNDQMFTRADDAARCWDFFHQHVEVPADALYLDPCVGGGAFYNVMPAGRRVGYDLDPQPGVAGVVRQDFLQLSPLDAPVAPGFYAISNVPFGFRSSVALAFVEQTFALGAAAAGYIVPAGMLPEPDGTPSSVGRRLSNAHAAYFFDGIDNFELPDGRPHFVQNCGFVIYLPGPPPPRPLRSCSTYVRLCAIQTYDKPENDQHWTRTEAMINRCHLFIRASRFLTDRKPMVVDRPMDEQANWIGVELLRDRDAVEAFLRGVDWIKVGRICGAKNVSINSHHVRQQLMDRGFIDCPPRCSAVSIACLRPDSSARDPIVEASDIFIRTSFYPSQWRKGDVVSREWKGWTNCFGIRIYRDRDAILKVLESEDWMARGRVSLNTTGNLTTANVLQAIVDAGYGD